MEADLGRDSFLPVLICHLQWMLAFMWIPWGAWPIFHTTCVLSTCWTGLGSVIRNNRGSDRIQLGSTAAGCCTHNHIVSLNGIPRGHSSQGNTNSKQGISLLLGGPMANTWQEDPRNSWNSRECSMFCRTVRVSFPKLKSQVDHPWSPGLKLNVPWHACARRRNVKTHSLEARNKENKISLCCQYWVCKRIAFVEW